MTEFLTNEEIRRERERRYLELWPTPWHALEDMSRNGVDSLFMAKDRVRAELPYAE